MQQGRCFPWDTGGMYTVELYARVRRAVHVDERSQREVAREFGLARKYAQDTEMLGCGARLGRMRRSSENIGYEDPSNRSCGYNRQ